jgi:hypothetical protein
MTRTEVSKFKGKEEHLIFVKNVPADVAITALPKMYEQYDPLRFKNVYPNGDITTLVVGFRTYEEASYAQQETDGMRFENVVLRVEMYSNHRSVRYLREARNSHRPLGTSADCEEEEEETAPEPEYILPFGKTKQETTGRTTWARIAGKTGALGMMPLPPPPRARETQHSTLSRGTPVSTPSLKMTVPYIVAFSKADETDSGATLTDSFPQRSSHTTTFEVSGYEREVEDNQKIKKRPVTSNVEDLVHTSLFAEWEPIDSTKRFAQRHCRDCAFCKLCERSRVERMDQCSDVKKVL